MATTNRSSFHLSLFGLMVMVAEFALVFALDKLMGVGSIENRQVYVFSRFVGVTCSTLVVLSGHVVLTWPGRGSLPMGRLLRHPGFSGPAIALVVTFAMLVVRSFMPDYEFRLVFPFLLWVFTGMAVATGWLLTVWAGVWRSASCRSDQAGRLLGCLWMAGTLLACLIVFAPR